MLVLGIQWLVTYLQLREERSYSRDQQFKWLSPGAISNLVPTELVVGISSLLYIPVAWMHSPQSEEL